MKVIQYFLFLPKWILIGIISIYQQFFSPLLGPRCRFYPTCSQYAQESLKQLFFPKAVLKITWRILRCAPWSKGGYDPVIKNKSLKEDNYV